MPTEMELTLEQTQQGVSYEVSDMLEQALDRKSTTGGCQFLDVDQYHAVQETNSGLLGFRRPLQNLPAAGKAKKSVKLMMEKLFRMELELMLAKTINGEVQLHALVDGKKIIIIESTVRRDLQLEDVEGVDCLPNSTIFEQLTLMGSNTTAWNEFSSTMASAIIYLATNQKFNFSKYIFENEVVHKELGDSLVRAATTTSSLESKQDSGDITKTRSKAIPNESSSLGTTSGGGHGVLDLEKTNTTQDNEIASLKRRVKKLEKKNRSRTHRLKRLYKVGLKARVESSGDEESLGEDASKQERINVINADE
ncbi:hypothetical protein Tco_0949128 [Tanacetum coccineum]